MSVFIHATLDSLFAYYFCDDIKKCMYINLPAWGGSSAQNILIKWVCVEIQHIWRLIENPAWF